MHTYAGLSTSDDVIPYILTPSLYIQRLKNGFGRSSGKLPAQHTLNEEHRDEGDNEPQLLRTEILVIKADKAYVQGKSAKTLLTFNKTTLAGLCKRHGLVPTVQQTKAQLVDSLIQLVRESILLYLSPS